MLIFFKYFEKNRKTRKIRNDIKLKKVWTKIMKTRKIRAFLPSYPASWFQRRVLGAPFVLRRAKLVICKNFLLLIDFIQTIFCKFYVPYEEKSRVSRSYIYGKLLLDKMSLEPILSITHLKIYMHFKLK